MIRTTARFAALAAVVLALPACSLLKTPPPAQMYRFGVAPEVAAAAPASAPIDLALNRIRFAEAVDGDRILGVTGTQAAYIGGARWVSDADDLFTASLEAAFAAQSRRVRLVAPRATQTTTQALDIEVRSFEARYAAPETAPVVVVTAWVRLLDTENRAISAERVFSVQQPASENRVSAIVGAFDTATRDLNAQIVEWTDAGARAPTAR